MEGDGKTQSQENKQTLDTVSTYAQNFPAENENGSANWNKVFDERTQRHYWINLLTNEVSWDLPVLIKNDIAIPEAKRAKGVHGGEVNNKENYEAIMDPKMTEKTKDEGKNEGTEKVNGESFDAADKTLQGKMKTGLEPVSGDVNDPSNWKTAIDHETGRQYYYNLITRQTQWANYGDAPMAAVGEYPINPQITGRRRRRSMKEMQDAWDRGDRVGLWECPDCSKILTEGSKKTHPDSCNARKARSVHMVQGTPSDILLGAHWRTVKDQNGQTYYYNKETKKTSWFKPNEMQNYEQYQQNQAIIQNSLGCSSVSFHQWTDVTDSNGRVYYFNNITGDTCWNKPAEGVIEQASEKGYNTTMGNTVTSDSAKSDWVEVIDTNMNRKYYYNTVTKESSWTDPNENKNQIKNNNEQGTEKEESVGEPANANVVTQKEINAQTGNSSVRGGWNTAIDKATGRTYYYHTVTSEVYWELPPGVNTEMVDEQPLTTQRNIENPPQEPTLENGSQKTYDEDSKRFYYQNSVTNVNKEEIGDINAPTGKKDSEGIRE